MSTPKCKVFWKNLQKKIVNDFNDLGLTPWKHWIHSGWLFVEWLYIKTINRSKRAHRRNGGGREKLLRAIGWPNPDLWLRPLTSWIIRVFFERTERTVLTASFVNDFNDLHRTAPLEQISPGGSFFRPGTPLTQKNKGFSNLNFLNDFKDLHTDDLTVVVELDRSSVAVEQAPPNPSSAIVVADL